MAQLPLPEPLSAAMVHVKVPSETLTEPVGVNPATPFTETE
jgi:hypothetical protein